MALNNIILAGRLTRDPEIKNTTNGNAVVNFTVATDRPYAQKDGKKESDFLNCVAWRNTADFISKYFTKGAAITVIGRIQTRSYEKDGVKQYVTEVLVERAYFGGTNHNAATIWGRLTRDPEIRRTTDGTPCASFTLAVDRDVGGENKEADFISCVAWRSTAEFISKYFKKGMSMMPSGALQTRSYEKDGVKHTIAELVVSNVEFGEFKKADAS